jgi:hypothetical protein
MSVTIKSQWTPHPGQDQVLGDDSRFRVVACGRRWGKTEMCAHECARALGGPDTLVWWVAPTYDIADIGFKAVEQALPEVVIADQKRTKPKAIDLVNGSRISFRSADREDSLRGEGLELLIIDEAAMVPERAWSAELRPTLSDTLGDMIAISTPKGRGWFYRWFERGQSNDHPKVNSWRSPTYQNPHIPDSEVDAAQDEQPQRVWEQEYLAEFKDESGGVFEGLEENLFTLNDYPSDNRHSGPYAHGWDFARHQDYLVGITLDADGQLVNIERSQGDAWPHIQRLIENTEAKYPGTVTVDASRDNKIVSDLEGAGISINPVTFSPKKKRQLIENLVTTIENGELSAPDVEDTQQLRHELQIFEYDVTRAGNVRYRAPEGFHDDCVDALALANSANSAVVFGSPAVHKA